MPWWNWVLFSVSILTISGIVWRYISIHVTASKRLKLINRCKISGDHGLACKEFDEVTFGEHGNAVFFFHNPKKLYGPLIQGVWDTDLQQAYTDFWWKCYKEIYLKAPRTTQRTISRLASEFGLMGSLTALGYDLDYSLLDADPPPKFSMVDGAEEYEQIMAMQEIGL